jgi:hypothetical protein
MCFVQNVCLGTHDEKNCQVCAEQERCAGNNMQQRSNKHAPREKKNVGAKKYLSGIFSFMDDEK